MAAHSRMVQQAQRDAVQRAARRGLAEVSGRPQRQLAVEEETLKGLVTGLATAADPTRIVASTAPLGAGKLWPGWGPLG
jgi:hypothetical protein